MVGARRQRAAVNYQDPVNREYGCVGGCRGRRWGPCLLARAFRALHPPDRPLTAARREEEAASDEESEQEEQPKVRGDRREGEGPPPAAVFAPPLVANWRRHSLPSFSVLAGPPSALACRQAPRTQAQRRRGGCRRGRGNAAG